MIIKNKEGKVIHNLTNYIEDSSVRYRKLRGEDNLTLNFSLPIYIDVPVGSKVEFLGTEYTLEKPENFKKRGSEHYEYTLFLEGAWERTRKYKFREKTDDKFTKLKFSLTAKPEQHLQMLIDNLNARESGWTIGDKIIDSVEKTISYSHTSCDDVINMIANAFETEWEIIGKTISLCKVEHFKDAPLPLSYGKGNGFRPGVGRSNFGDKAPVEVLYVQGGEKNINFNTYHSKELLLPKLQRLIYEDREYISSEDGLSIQRYDIKPVYNNEDSLDCTEIYPKREGVISYAKEEDKANHFYDIADASIPDSLDYHDCIIDGETMTMIFQSGMLAGREFGVIYHHEERDGKPARRFEIKPQEYDGVMMPNETFKPKATVGKVEGDTYAIFGCMIPEDYVCNNKDKLGASWDMFKEAARYMYENENPQFSFMGELSAIWAKQNWEEGLRIRDKITVGGYVFFSDDQFHQEGTKIRIVGIKQYVNNPHAPVLDLSNAPVTSSTYYDLAKIETNEVTVDDNHKKAIQYAKRGYRDAKETVGMLQESLLANFSNAINPVTIESMALLIGDAGSQFCFVKNRPTDEVPTPVVFDHIVTYDKESRTLDIPGGTIQHLTMDIKSVSSSHNPSEYRYWKLAGLPTQPLEPAAKYWLYAKVMEAKNAPLPTSPDYQGEFILSKKPIIMKGGDCYYLLIGTLNSEYNGDRADMVKLYGFTEILPGRITTDLIVSADGKTYFDLENSEIGGRIVFNSASGEKKTLPELEGNLNTLENSLGAAAYKDVIEKALLGKTIIDGGYLKTGLINTDTLIAKRVEVPGVIISKDKVSITGEINATGGEFRNVKIKSASFGDFVMGDDMQGENVSAGSRLEYDQDGDIIRFLPSQISNNAAGQQRNILAYFETPDDNSFNLALATKGRVDLPGVLASYNADSVGTVRGYYGEKVDTENMVAKEEGTTGLYKVHHIIRHSNYTVSANAQTSGHGAGVIRVCEIVERTDTYVIIAMGDINNHLQDCGFDITLFGRNY